MKKILRALTVALVGALGGAVVVPRETQAQPTRRGKSHQLQIQNIKNQRWVPKKKKGINIIGRSKGGYGASLRHHFDSKGINWSAKR